MLSITEAQLNALLIAYLYPLVRVLGLFAAAPLFNSRSAPMRTRVGLAVIVAAALVPGLPAATQFDPGSYPGLLALAQQALIGIAMGMSMRLVFAAIEMAGEVIGFQMSLSFATAFDPENGGQSAVLQEFLTLLATMTFLALDGHLMLIAALNQSFTALPVSTAPLGTAGFGELARAGAYVFSAGAMLALPLIAALLITSIALGVLTRAAPQLNLFAVGFPITISVGFAMLALTLQYMAPNFERFFLHGMETMDVVLRGMATR